VVNKEKGGRTEEKKRENSLLGGKERLVTTYRTDGHSKDNDPIFLSRVEQEQKQNGWWGWKRG